MTNVFNSIRNAISLEKTFEKGTKSLVADFIADITASNAESVKKALKDALKKAGFIPSNCFSMKAFNTAVAIAAAGIAVDDAGDVMDFLKIKPAHGEKMTADKIAAAVEKSGDIAAVVKSAKEAATPDAKKAAKTAAAKKGAATRVAAKKGGIIPAAVRQAAQSADSAKAEKPLEKQATPAAQLDRAINTFCALSEQGKADFVRSMWKELLPIVKSENEKRKQKKVA